MRSAPTAERGSVTMETAMVLPALLVVLTIGLGGVGAANAQLSCADAARIGARALARGETPERARSLAEEVAPAGARVDLTTESSTALVSVSAAFRLGPEWAPTVEVAGDASVPLEPGL
ncbi:TadE family protein [Nocardiopsis alba]|uniref:TadE family protein n=1 Tax=Nocardiopsis alba TaxID=53437 RepID=A0ABV5E1X3_9ACTN